MTYPKNAIKESSKLFDLIDETLTETEIKQQIAYLNNRLANLEQDKKNTALRQQQVIDQIWKIVNDNNLTTAELAPVVDAINLRLQGKDITYVQLSSKHSKRFRIKVTNPKTFNYFYTYTDNVDKRIKSVQWEIDNINNEWVSSKFIEFQTVRSSDVIFEVSDNPHYNPHA
jgi:predicted DNA binding CopG/RHH family protein